MFCNLLCDMQFFTDTDLVTILIKHLYGLFGNFRIPISQSPLVKFLLDFVVCNPFAPFDRRFKLGIFVLIVIKGGMADPELFTEFDIGVTSAGTFLNNRKHFVWIIFYLCHYPS